MDNVNHPAHYETGFAPKEVECIDVVRHLPFTIGNAIKYIWRAGKKGTVEQAREDLDKANWYLKDWFYQNGEDAPIPGSEKARVAFSFCTPPPGSYEADYKPLERARYHMLNELLVKKSLCWSTLTSELACMSRVLNNTIGKATKDAEQ